MEWHDMLSNSNPPYYEQDLVKGAPHYASDIDLGEHRPPVHWNADRAQSGVRSLRLRTGAIDAPDQHG
jgi:hypothetical protein